MDAKKRQQVTLAALSVVLAIVVYVQWPATQPPAAGRDSVRRGGQTTRGSASDLTRAETPDVHMEALESGKPPLGAIERDLFKFKPRYVPPPPRPAPAPAAPVQSAPPMPTSPPVPSVAPIPFKFIGIIESPGSSPVAILSDGKGGPVYGRAGESVLGQYRIVRIGTESIEMEYIDGRGRQTIRLSGS